VRRTWVAGLVVVDPAERLHNFSTIAAQHDRSPVVPSWPARRPAIECMWTYVSSVSWPAPMRPLCRTVWGAPTRAGPLLPNIHARKRTYVPRASRSALKPRHRSGSLSDRPMPRRSCTGTGRPNCSPTQRTTSKASSRSPLSTELANAVTTAPQASIARTRTAGELTTSTQRWPTPTTRRRGGRSRRLAACPR